AGVTPACSPLRTTCSHPSAKAAPTNRPNPARHIPVAQVFRLEVCSCRGVLAVVRKPSLREGRSCSRFSDELNVKNVKVGHIEAGVGAGSFVRMTRGEYFRAPDDRPQRARAPASG